MLSKPSWSYQPVCSWKHFFTEPITMVMCLSLTMSRSQLTLLTGAETSPHGVNVTGPTCIRGCSQMTSTLSAGFTSDQPCIEGTLYTLNTWVVWSEYCWYVAGENDDIIYEQALILNVSREEVKEFKRSNYTIHRAGFSTWSYCFRISQKQIVQLRVRCENGDGTAQVLILCTRTQASQPPLKS